MKTDALLIFTRNPELGKVKQDLKTIGNEKRWLFTTICFAYHD
jgi:hypothetical protein